MSNLVKFRTHLVQARMSKATVDIYISHARDYAKFCRGTAYTTIEDAIAAYLSTFSDRAESTQSVALNALAGGNGLYAALGRSVGKLPSWARAKKPDFVPAWVTVAECNQICRHLTEPWSLMCRLMVGTGLRVGEVVSLRWRDLDFERMTVTVKQSKGKKDRITFLPRALVGELRDRKESTHGLWAQDRRQGRPGVMVPRSILNKSPKAGEDWPFFWVFPAAGDSRDPDSGIVRRHHIHKGSLARSLRIAVVRSGIAKRVTCHSFRHGFATSYLLAGGNTRELQDLLGHKSLETTEIYLHCLPKFASRVGSPLDTPCSH